MSIKLKYFEAFCYYIIVNDEPFLSWGISVFRFKRNALFLVTRDEMSFLWLLTIKISGRCAK